MATEYERKRLENIKRNDEKMAALKVHAKASLLSAATAAKRSRRDDSKSFKKKKVKPDTPTVIRQSLRTRGLNPDSGGLPDDFSDNPKRFQKPPSPKKSSPRILAPLSFDSAHDGEGSHTEFVDTLLDIARKSCRRKMIKDEIESPMVKVRCTRSKSNVVVKKDKPDDSLSDENVKKEFDIPVKPGKIEFEDGFDQDLLSLEPHNVARVVPGRILVVKFLPCEDVRMVAAGDKSGNVGFWNLDCENEENDGVYLFNPHSAPVSSLVFQQNSLPRVISSSYDGLIRMMDVEKLVFDLVYSTDKAIFSLSQRPNDEQSLYFGEGNGLLNIWDLRAGKSVSHWDLHDIRINSIDFNPQNPHVMGTSSTDGTACLWDLRSTGEKPKTLTTINHSRAVHSAYFSLSGLLLATTSYDNYLGILSGVNYETTSMIYHNNTTNRWISSFRGVWGWDDSYVYVGNLAKKIDVINPTLKRTVMELPNPLMKAIPCRIHCHPLTVGMLAGSTTGGQVYVWTAN